MIDRKVGRSGTPTGDPSIPVPLSPHDCGGDNRDKTENPQQAERMDPTATPFEPFVKVVQRPLTNLDSGAEIAVMPASARDLWNKPARPYPRVLLPNGYVRGGTEGVYLDEQLLEFVTVVASMIADYPEQYRDEICHDFREELREFVQGF